LSNKKKHGIWVLRTILDEGRREGEICKFWGYLPISNDRLESFDI
jgi:hypothetical protein